MLNKDDINSIQIQIEVCTEEIEQLNEWETEFIESINDQLTMNGKLSLKQKETLKRIYDKVV